MVGLIVKHGTVIVVATGATTEEAEEVAMALLQANGMELVEEEVDMLIFDPAEKGGVLLETEAPPDMSGWSADGFTG